MEISKSDYRDSHMRSANLAFIIGALKLLSSMHPEYHFDGSAESDEDQLNSIISNLMGIKDELIMAIDSEEEFLDSDGDTSRKSS